MIRRVTILIVEDDDGHAALITKNLKRAALDNPIVRFSSGDEALEFLYTDVTSAQQDAGNGWLVLLDIRMPGTDGIEVLRRMKDHPTLRRLPVIMLSTTDDPQEVNLCYDLGCSSYIVKPVNYTKLSEAVQRLGLFISLIEVPLPALPLEAAAV